MTPKAETTARRRERREGVARAILAAAPRHGHIDGLVHAVADAHRETRAEVSRVFWELVRLRAISSDPQNWRHP